MDPNVNSVEGLSSTDRNLIAVARIAVVALLFGGAVTAASANDVYYACLKKNGKLDSVVVNAVPKCKPNETLTQWNETGPAGPQGDQGPQGPAGPSALWANVRSDGVLLQQSEGVSASRLRTGVYRVTFPQNVGSCAISISALQYLGTGIIGINPGAIDPPPLSHVFFSVYGDISTANSVVIGERDITEKLVDGPFSVSAICP